MITREAFDWHRDSTVLFYEVDFKADRSGVDAMTYALDRPGLSAFAMEDGAVYHTYSSYARGVDSLWGMYQWLDRAPKGSNEAGLWFRRHDEYGRT